LLRAEQRHRHRKSNGSPGVAVLYFCWIERRYATKSNTCPRAEATGAGELEASSPKRCPQIGISRVLRRDRALAVDDLCDLARRRRVCLGGGLRVTEPRD